MDERVIILVRGHVQNVGFLWWARRTAHQLGLTGYASEVGVDGVEVVAQGRREALYHFLELVNEPITTTRRPGRILSAVCRFEEPLPGLYAFHAA